MKKVHLDLDTENVRKKEEKKLDYRIVETINDDLKLGWIY